MLKVFAEVHERLIHYQPDAFLAAPLYQFFQSLHRNEITRRIIGIDEQQAVNVLVVEIAHQVICCIAQVFMVREESNDVLLSEPMGVLFKRRVDDANMS